MIISKTKISLTLIITTITVITIYWTWTNRKTEINTLDNRIIQFNELPPVVADMFRNTKKYWDIGMDDNILTTDSINSYRLESAKTGPWIDYTIIIKNEKIKYKVPMEKSFPFVIHDNELFIPDRHNIANTTSAEIARYEKYRLN